MPIDDANPPVANQPAGNQPELTAVREAFAGFLKLNPQASIGPSSEAAFRATISNAWNDDSVLIHVPQDFAELASALNSVFLPERFSALWHSDTRRMEFIFTALPLPPVWSDLPDRRFKFRFAGREHECGFGPSSTTLLAIAKNFRPGKSGSTTFRNLIAYTMDSRLPADAPKGRPLSFWVDNVEWNEDTVIDLANHMNFFMTYYDTISPTILIHNPQRVETPSKPQTRFALGKFPEYIDAREVDDPLLILWEASRQGDNARRFLYCYRIIEYSAFTYLEQKARLEVRKILAVPHAMSDIASVTNSVMDALQRSKLEDFQKCEALLRDTVRPSILWREIKEDIAAFTTETKFDGGFELAPLVSAGTNETSFEVVGVDRFHRAIREIRNALSHGKDLRSGGVIVPTTRNFERLRPWVAVTSAAAAEVMIFRSTL